MELVAIITNVSSAGPNVLISLMVASNQGHAETDAVEMALSSAASQLNSQIADAARQIIRTRHGLAVPANTPVTIFGGAVKA